jgi:hypothetical protein
VRAAGIATQYFCFGNARTTATFAHDRVTQNVFQYVEIETASLVEDRAQKGPAGNHRFEIAALAHNRDGERHGPIGGTSFIKGG